MPAFCSVHTSHHISFVIICCCSYKHSANKIIPESRQRQITHDDEHGMEFLKNIKMISSALTKFKKFQTSLGKYDATTTRNWALTHLDLTRNSTTKNMLISTKDADVQTTTSVDISMNGGDGCYSYAQNSTYQRGYIEAAKEILKQDIISKLEVKQISSTTSFRITDLGCSVGPNTYLAIDTIVEALNQKFKSFTPEIEVMFNDTMANDFNTLFSCLPSERRYYASATPGSFYGRLFPKSSIHIAFSSCTLCWLSKIPKEVTDELSTAYNKGGIHYDSCGRNEVFRAYKDQFALDMDMFLRMRAEEIVAGGLMALLVIAEPDTLSDGITTFSTELALLGSCLVDMAKQGIICSEKVDSFNIPLYYTRPKELKDLIIGNGSFSIERMEVLDVEKKANFTTLDVKMRSLCWRAILERLMGQHFGYEIVDEVFDRYADKISISSSSDLKPENRKTLMLFVMLKRCVD